MRNWSQFEDRFEASGSSDSVTAQPRLLDKWFLRPVLSLMLWYRKSKQDSVAGMRHRTRNSLSIQFRAACCTSLDSRYRNISQIVAHFGSHRRFRQQAPNDSVIIPVWGCDRYLKSSMSASARVAGVLELFQPAFRRPPEPVQDQAVPAGGVV